MGRAIGGAVVGYLVLFVFVFAALSAAWFALGAAGAFEPGGYRLTALWIAISLAVAACGGFLAGKVAAAIGRAPLAGRICAVLALVLNLALSLPILTGNVPPGVMPRPDSLPMFEALGHAVAPPWTAIVQPLFNAAFALLASRGAKPRS